MSSDDSPRVEQATEEDSPITKNLWFWAILASLIVLPAMRPCSRRVAPPPPILGEVSEVVLLDQDGQDFGPERFRQKVLLTAFLGSAATEEGELLVRALQRLAEGMEIAPEPDFMGLIVVSLDPQNDTPSELKQLATELDIDPIFRTLLTGDPGDVSEFTEHMLGRKVELGPGVWNPQLVLVDDIGRIRGRYDVINDSEGLMESFARAERTARESWEGRRGGRRGARARLKAAEGRK